LHHRADKSDIGAETRGLGTIDFHLPFDTGQRATIVNVRNARMLLDRGPNPADRVDDQIGIA
jgi:hypothetical protein